MRRAWPVVTHSVLGAKYTQLSRSVRNLSCYFLQSICKKLDKMIRVSGRWSLFVLVFVMLL
jgi:hypothetical protein